MKYITIPYEEYEALLEELEELKRRKDAPVPDIDDAVFLSPRLYGHLNRAGIKNLSELEKTSRQDWTRLPGFGRKSYEELKGIMKMYGMRFRDE